MEYESRRDADDAYHEMHNKRIGRDDLLKIEVCFLLPHTTSCFLGSILAAAIRIGYKLYHDFLSLLT